MNSWYLIIPLLALFGAYLYNWNKLNKYRHLVDKQHHAYCEILLQRFRDVETIKQLAEQRFKDIETIKQLAEFNKQLIEEIHGKEIRLN